MDLEKVEAGAAAYEEYQIAKQKAAEEEANKTTWDKLTDAAANAYDEASEVANSIANTAGEVADFAGRTIDDVSQSVRLLGGELNQLGERWQEHLHQGAQMQEAIQNGTFSQENVEAAQQAAGNYVSELERVPQAAVNIPKAAVRQTARAFINTYANDNNSALQPFAESLEQSDANLNYFMTSEEKLQKARKIEEEVGIPAEAVLSDDKAYKAALEVYNYKKRKENIEDVWEEYPEVKEIANLDPQAAALALHDIETVRKTHGIVESFVHFLESGNIKLEYDNLQYKIANGTADDNDRQRAEDLKKMMDADKRKAPSFWDDPAAAMAAGVAQSLPEMTQGITEGVKTAGPAIAAAALLTVATGGTDLLAVGAAAGTAAIRAALMRALASQTVKTVGTRAFQVGMFKGMMEPETGSRYAEMGELKDKNGNQLLSDDDRRMWAMLGGASNAGIEMLNFGLITNALKPAPQAAKVLEDIVAANTAKKTQQQKIMEMVGGKAKDWLKLTASESGEEALQSASDDIIHNVAVESTGERGSNNKTYSAGEIAGRAGAAFVESLPGSMGFGLVGAGGGMIGSAGAMARNVRNEARIAQTYGENAVHTMNGTIMVEQLQQAVASGKLKETAPDVQQKILREQLAGTGYEMAHIDVEMALQKENGVEDLKKVAKAAGMTSEELDAAISQQAYLNVPVEVLAQVESSPELLDTVTFKDNAESMARMRINQKELTEAYNEAVKRTIDNRQQLIDNIISQVLPKNATKEQKEMLETAIMMNPDNPAQGYAELRKAAKAEWEALLAAPINAMKEGARKGRNLYLPDEQGNLKMKNTPGENATWYSNFYNIFRREPTKKEYEDMAVALLTGDPSAPEVQGWTIDSLEAQQGMEQNKANIERIKGNLKALQEIKSAAESLTGVEMQLTEGLTPEGFKMYRQLSDWLRNVGGATARQARMGAILAARHADIYAAKVTERTGKKYTAEDYMRDKIGFSVRRADAGLNQLAGVNAINAPLEALERAKAMEAAAAYSDDIYKETGWIKGQDGKWRFEIPDNLDNVNWDVFKKGNTENKSRLLKSVYKNQKLYEAYPWLENIIVELKPMDGNTYGGVAKNNNGSYIVIKEDVGDEQKSGTLIHEIQHLIQDEEGFAVGGTDENASEQIIDRIRELNKRIQSYDYGAEYADTVMDQQEMILEGVENPEAEEILKSQIAELEKKIPAKERDEIWQLASDRQYLREALNENTGNDNSLYRNLAGEQEARHATERALVHTNVDRAEKELEEKKAKYEAEKAKQSPAMKKMLDELEVLREKDEKTDAEFERIDEIRAAMDEKLMQAETFYSWAKDTLEMRREEAAETPQPHNENAIVVFGGQEYAMSQAPKTREYVTIDGKTYRSKMGGDVEVEGEIVEDKGLFYAINSLENIGDIQETIAALKEDSEGPFLGLAEQAKAGLEFLQKAIREGKEIQVHTEEIHMPKAGVSPQTVITSKEVNKIRKTYGPFEGEGYNPRARVPKVRGGWTEKKILNYLKKHGTPNGVREAVNLISEFDSVEELKEHMFFHGSAGGSAVLKPSITMSNKEVARVGGGGYGEKYWGISVTPDKKIASRFSGEYGRSVNIYPIVLAKNAIVEEAPNLEDAADIAPEIVDYWTRGVDAVWIGDKNAGERELLILNPAAVVNIGRADTYDVFKLGTKENPLSIKNDKQIEKMLNVAKALKGKEEGYTYGSQETREEIFFQRAWHGSPYDFETFDLGAIGTGEGAQAHGWGLYFAQDKGVSKAYKERLTPDVESIDYYEIGGKQYAHDKRGKWVRLERRGDTWTEHDITPFERAVLFTFDKAEQDAQKAAESLKERLSGKNTPGDKAIQQGIDVLSGGVEKKNWKNSGGRLFDVEIPDNDVLLDEQKTLGEQPNINRLLEEYAEKTQDWSFTAGEINDEETTGEELYDWMVTILGSPKAASEELNKMGIKGITYEGARDGRCFVIFDDKAIDIIEKYNQQVAQQQIKGQTSLQANGKRIVSILETADESTFVHEMAHVFLYDLDDLAKIDDVSAKELEIINEWANWQKGAAAEYKDTPWAKEFAAREQAIIDAEAAGDYERADQLKREWRQERFARGFELYLKDGQAPAKGLKAVFRKFKQFLRQIYAAFVSDGGKPTLPVKRVMDRMIASEQEIEAMEMEDRYADVEKAGGAKLFDESEEDTYNRWYQEAEAEAKEKLLKVVMKDLEKEKQAQFDAEIEKVTADKRKELQQEPVYLAEQAVLASGDEKMALEWFPSLEAFRDKLASTPPLEEALKDYMEKYSTDLDSRLIEAHMSPEAVEKAMKTSKYRVKMEALKGKAMAKKLGLINKINSKAEMAMASIEEKLTALPKDTDLKVDSDSAGVKAIMAEINKLKFSAKWNKDELNHIESMIRAATQDEMRKAIADLRESKALDKEKEREILQANEGRQRIFRDIARQAMQEKKISDSCNVNYYVQQEKKMARRVRDMIRAKRWDMAMQAQEQQGMYTAMAEIAEQNREERNRLLSQVQRELAARTVRLPKNERYWHRKLAYILRINKTEPMPPEQGYVELSALLKNMEDSLDILEHSLDSVLSIANQGENFRGYKDLTMDEFKEAVNSLHVIYTVGRDKFKMKTVSGKSLFDVVDESIHEEKTVAGNIEVDTRKVNPDKGGLAYSELIGNTGDVGHLIAKRGQDYIASSVKPENILKMIGSTAHRYIYGTLEKAAENEAKMQAKNIETLRDIMSVYSHKERQDWSKKIYDLSTEKGDKISKEQIMCMALNWGTLSNRQRLLGGLASDERTPEAVGKMTEEVMRLFEETMTAKDWQVIQKLWDHISSYWEDTVKVEEKLNGTTLEKVHATPFTITSADGQEMKMRGGYMPIKYDAEKSSRAEENETNELVQSIHAGVQRLGAGRSYTKSRTEFDMWDPLKLEFSVVENHLQDVIHNATYRLPVRDVYRIITNKQFEEHVVNHLGREYHNILKDWALDSWRQFNPNTNTADNFISWGLGKLRGNSTMAIMGYRVWAAIENISNLPIAASKIGTGQMMAALCDFYPGLIDNMKSIKQKSLFMRNRLDNLDRDIRSQAGIFHADNKLFEITRDHAYDFLVYTDLMVSAPLWMRAYKKAYEPMVQKVKEENEANIAYLLKCQAEVDSIRAEIADLRGEANAMNEHLKERRYASPETAEMLRQSPFAMHTDNDLRAISGENLKKAKAKEKDLWEAEVKFQEAQEIKILSDDEILDEAENRAVLEADGAVRDTFGSGRTIDLPAVQRSKNEITKLLTTFYGFFNTQFNAVYMSYVNSKYLPAENAITKWAPFAKQIVFRFVFPALIGSVLQYGLGLAGGSDDEKKRKVKDANGKTVEVDIPSYERFLKVFTKNVISTGTGSMYLVRDVVNAVSDFVINDKTYGINSGSVAGRGASEVGKMFVLLSKKGQKDAEIQAKAEKKEREHQEKLAKLKGKKRQEYLKKYEENKQYEKPPKRITYAEIAGHGLKGLSSFTAAQTGITSTMVNAATSTMQYLLDSDMRYDPTWKNIIWSALFDKKPVEREIPKKPPAEPKTKKKKKKSSSDGK